MPDVADTFAGADDRPPPVRTWQDAERLAAWHLRRLGFHDAHITVRGTDAGVDVRGSGVVAQVKFHATKAGRPEMQALHGAATAEMATAVFYATGYSMQA